MRIINVTSLTLVFTVAAAMTAVAVAADYHNRLSGVDWTDSVTVGHNLAFRQGLDGWTKAAPHSTAPDYLIQLDPNGPAPGLPSALLAARTAHPRGYGTLIQGIRADRYQGKRLRLSASLRTVAVAQEAGLWLRMDGQRGVRAWNMMLHPITGTTGWRRYAYVVDVPPDAQGMAFGSDLTGTGKVWLADVRLEIVGKDIPVTSDVMGELPGNTARVLHLWELGRANRNTELENAAKTIIADPKANPAERCTAREGLVIAEMRLGRMHQARLNLATFNRERQGLPIDPGVVREARSVAAWTRSMPGH